MTETERAEIHERWEGYCDWIATEAVRLVAATHGRTEPTFADVRTRRAVARLLEGVSYSTADDLVLGIRLDTKSAVSHALATVERALADFDSPVERKAAA